MNPEIRMTEDGSETVFSGLLNEGYHSKFGAFSESRHVFLNAGLKSVQQPPPVLFILEIGFGTGLNTLLSLIESESSGQRMEYDALEPFPLPEEVTGRLNFPLYLGRNDLADVFMKLHNIAADQAFQLTPLFAFRRSTSKLQDFQEIRSHYHLIYFDAFSPEVQPEMWTTEHFRKLFACLKEGGILVTYSSKGSVKRSLKEAGFSIERLPGPPGKRHMLRASK